MGSVYLARRDDGLYERDVAIKILRSGLESTGALHRFLAERQILARLEHPGIARLYDGGRTPDGRPFLVMELVDGLPLDEYCDRHRLSVERRLDLFLRICAAVQHAHQNLLVHRDLKPANILVTAAGEPKLLDFGIAKRLGPESGAGDRTVTRTGLRVMTPSYASPEQVRGEAITTASDVYSLGVLLYELLAGRGPYRVENGLPHEVERAICDEEPERPSQALFRPPRGAGDPSAEEIAEARGTRPQALRRQLRGDLDTIVLKALRKEPQRRYGSAAQLAEDLERHLRDLPVVARPDSLLYRTRKLLRRRRVAAAAVLVAALVALGFVLSLVEQGRRLARERDKARTALSFLVETFKNADPYHTRGRRLTAEEVLDQGAARVSRELRHRPEVQAAVLDAIGEVYIGQGRVDEAAPLLERALAMRRRAAGADPLALAATLEHLAQARYTQSRFAAAERLLREALALRRRAESDGADVARTLNQLGAVISVQRASPEVAKLHHEALALARQAEGAGGLTVAESLLHLALLARDEGRYEEAERLYRDGLAMERRLLSPRDPQLLGHQLELSSFLLDTGKPQEAEALLRATLKVQRRVHGAKHPDLMMTINNLGLARYQQKDLAGAEALYREALAQPSNPSAESGMVAAAPLGNLATVLQAQGRHEEAIPYLQETLAVRRKALGDRNPQVAHTLLGLARAERARRRYPEALDIARRALAIYEEAEGPRHPHVAFALREISNNLMDRDQPAAAEPHLRRALDIRRHALAPGHPDLAKAQLGLGFCLFELGRDPEAEALLQEGRAALAVQAGPQDELVRQADERLARIAARRRAAGPVP
jgi:serine/threonine-protein kinase